MYSGVRLKHVGSIGRCLRGSGPTYPNWYCVLKQGEISQLRIGELSSPVKIRQGAGYTHRVYTLPHDDQPLLSGAHLKEGGARLEDIVKILIIRYPLSLMRCETTLWEPLSSAILLSDVLVRVCTSPGAPCQIARAG